ncbi:MAG: diguanylate cyclase [Spirochaetaceae bacterium]|nr:MAG: diguanylate cyclase [Spirochaetaceae bacterium]
MTTVKATTGRTIAICCALLLILVILAACVDADTARLFAPHSYTGPRARGGRLDLRGANLSRPLPLDGEWLFYPRELVGPDQLDTLPPPVPIEVPALWNHQLVAEHPFGAHGFGTYRLDLLLDKPLEPHYLRVNEISTAFRVYAGEALVLRGGEVGTSPQTTVPAWITTTHRLLPQSEELTLLVQVANFHHARGGIRDELLISRRPNLLSAIQARRNFNWFVFGALLVMGIYHLGLITVRTRERSTLWFGLVSILMALRATLTGQPALVEAESLAMWELLMTLEYFTMYVGFTLFFLYTAALFPQEMHQPVLRAIQILGMSFGALTLVTPARIFTATLYGFHVMAVLGSAYLVYVAFRAMRAGRAGATIYAAGMALLWVTVVNDVLYNLGVVRTGYYTDVGLLVFLFFQSLALATRFTANVRRIEELLAERNRLESLTFRDSLTGISNRRHFDLTLSKEWTRAQRHSQPLSVIMADIDEFKAYNDNYGHLLGDKALTQVAHTLHNTLNRSSDFVARYGGEEFAVILPSTTDEGALKIAETMRGAIESLCIEHRYSGLINVMTASFGVATAIPHRDGSSDSLLSAADQALYRAKQNCKNCVM